MKKHAPIKTKVMVIVHGRSEYCICTAIHSNLRIKQEIIARDRGQSSIQINGIMNILLNDRRFKTFKAFIKAFPKIEHDQRELLNFKLFIIMDLDDCKPDIKKRFLNKDLFSKHWLKDYIVPIYNDPNLEKTMEQAGIEVKKKKDYVIIFPTNKGDLDCDMARDFKEKLEECKCTNMDEYVKYCISIFEENTYSLH